MSEQILSQEEINALLNAMSKGEVDLESDRGETPNVRPYDFKTRGKMLQHQFHALDEVNDNLASLLQRSISSFLKRSVAVEFGSMEMMKFSEFMKIFPTPAIFGIFSMEPLVGSALVAVESGLALALVDCMFGGDGKLMPRDRDFTSIEKRLMGKFSRDLLSHLEAAWQGVYAINNRFKKLETKPEFLHLVEPGDGVIVIAYSLDGDGFFGKILFCIPYLILEPIKGLLSLRCMIEKDTEQTWNNRIQTLLKDTRVTLTAELGRTHRRVRDILNLRVDDIVKLNIGPQDLVTLNVEGVPKYRSFPGVVKGNRAVQITELIHHERGTTNDG